MSDLAQITSEVCKLVGSLSADERNRVMAAVAVLCGDTPTQAATTTSSSSYGAGVDESIPPKAQRWLVQCSLTYERVQEVFHVEGSKAEVIATEIPGKSKREQTANCYLFEGIRNLLSSGEPTIREPDAVALCRKYKCHDGTNHSSYRKQAGGWLAGNKDDGFVLSAPGLKAAGELLKE